MKGTIDGIPASNGKPRRRRSLSERLVIFENDQANSC
jgi:hypothetical protein